MKEKWRERLLAIASVVGYPFFYIFCLVVFASWTFPLDKARDRLVASFNESQRASNSSRELAITEVSSSWVTGLKLTGVRFIDNDTPAPGEAGKATAAANGDLKLDSVVVRIALLPLLLGRHDVTFRAEAFGGKVEGSWKEHGKDRALEVTLESLGVGQITPLTQLLEVPMDGALAGKITFELPEGHVTKANGSIVIEAVDVALGDGKAKLMGKLPIPRLSLGNFALNAEVKDGTLKLTKLGATGKDVDFLADGRMPLHDPITESQVDLNLRFRVSDSYKGKNEATKGLFGEPGSSVPGVMDLDPRVKQAKRADGFYTWHGRGPLGKIDFSPGGTGGPVSGPGGSSGGAAPVRPKSGP